ncbi:hypothetical protein BGZ97_007506 [Linnemannia gamsii]|uniref:Tail specific protease domain-containing protein n=1 Tax=Linnemannia gamsii TaxID=64522 RepID=A0A9P6QS42_9FUNG|nr:hypothetical protein BGZ97_007506 [Linnemannia gamsii]
MKVTPLLTIAAAICMAATSTTEAAPKPKPQDPCAELAKQGTYSNPQLTYDVVKRCFNNHKFNPDVAAKVLSSLENTLGNFFVFIDQAKVGPTKVANNPLDTKPVDVLKELDAIRKKKWANDYEFQLAVTRLAASFNDGHVNYRNFCYMTAKFTQPISLYAPVVNGKQDIRVYYVDTTIGKKGLPKNPSSLVDCVVQTIDGQPALKAIQDFTDRVSAVSKDPGVRLNDALASTSWYEEWYSSPGGFANRYELPASDSVKYTIQCPKGPVQTLTVPWVIRPSDYYEYSTFTDTKSYWEVQCQNSAAYYNGHSNSRSSSPSTAAGRILSADAKKGASETAPALTTFRERGRITQPKPGQSNGRNGEPKTPAVISQAKLVATSRTSAFYRLTGSKVKDACVAVIATEDTEEHEYDSDEYLNFAKGLQKLQSQGCTKLILDMTNNGGGLIDFAYYINRLLFPKADPYFVQDIRTNKMIQDASRRAIKSHTARSMLDATQYVSATTNKLFKDTSMFTKDVKQKRGGATVTFSQRSYFPFNWPFLPLKKGTELKFKPQNMAIITNGFCGSACSMIATRFAITQKVKTYAIGGIAKRPLSYFSFPGGFVTEVGSVVSDLSLIRYKAPGKTAPTQLPVMASANLPMGELYAYANSTVPLEYDSQFYAATVHLDQDPVSARHPDNVWVKIAGDLTSQKK